MTMEQVRYIQDDVAFECNRSHGVHEDPEEEFDATIELNDGSTASMEYKAHRSE